MTTLLVAADEGCRVFHDACEAERELDGHSIGALAHDGCGGCIAVVDNTNIWRRSAGADWSRVAETDMPLQSLLAVSGDIYAGGMDTADVLRISESGMVNRLDGFDRVPGRENWYAGGPPLGVRSLAGIPLEDGAGSPVILAAVHVGGMPRSIDGGETWTPTIPINHDVHEVRAHPSHPGIFAAATAVGLCVCTDGGKTWHVHSAGPINSYALAVALLESELLFSTSDGPFADRSQIWRWSFGSGRLTQVRDGLPEWLDGKVDTGGLVTGSGRAALLDGGGNLWLSTSGSTGWQRIATGVGYSFGLLIVQPAGEGPIRTAAELINGF